MKPHDGLYACPGETLQLTPAGEKALTVFALASPRGALEWPASMPHIFDADSARRVGSVDRRPRTLMDPRRFRTLGDNPSIAYYD